MYWLAQLLNALSFGAVLYLVAIGLTLIMGVMRVVNLMHGSGYLMGAYVAVVATEWSGSFLVGLASAIIAAALVAGIVYLLLERVGDDLMRQAVLTFAFVFILGDLSLGMFGGSTLRVPLPAGLEGSVTVGNLTYPTYRLVLIGVVAVVATSVFLIEQKTLWGALVRAVADKPAMVAGIGQNPRVIAFATFICGMALAFAGGVLGGAVFGAYPGADIQFLVLGLVVVVLGGMGSLHGSLFAALIVGLVSTFSQVLWPTVGDLSIFLLLVAVLLVRPHGLLGRTV